MPLSVSFTLVNFLSLFNYLVLSACEYVSPVSHLTNICPARSSGRTLVGALDIQISFCMLMLHVHLSPYTPPFYRQWLTSGPGHPPGSPRTRRPWNLWNIKQCKYNDLVVYRRPTRIFLPYINSNRSELKGWADLPELLPYFEMNIKSNERFTKIRSELSTLPK